jgi:hypothetical protein
MAIIGPNDLPHVLKADSNPLKLRMLHHFGHPNVRVELTEPQMEEMLRVTGDFICQYFPLEERYAYFYTQPLVEEYDLPADAYWIREVAWDPVMNRIQDIFGAEMFLFCISYDDAKILTEDGLKYHEDLEPDNKLITPYGLEDYSIEIHEEKQPLMEIVYQDGSIKCTTNQPIKINNFNIEDSLDGWVNASELKVGDNLVTKDGVSIIESVSIIDDAKTVTIKTESGCFYACSEGKPIIIH